jgi:peptide/nickel transport system ATP-binding protein
LRMVRPDSGEIRYDGQDILSMRGAELRQYRRLVQPIFQDPSGSLNPRFSVFDAIAESFVIHHVGKTPERRRKVAKLLDQVGMPISVMDRRSSDLSGGQKQRVAIARAIASDPQTLVCDEVVSALDVLVQAQILDLLTNLQQELALTYVFISHDLAVVRQMATKVMVMQAGKVVEAGDCEEVFLHPQNAYTKDLLASIPGASGLR